jgi:uncharacterized protein
MKSTQVTSMIWKDLVFLHWEIDKNILQKKLPSGFTLDLFEGKAYVSIVPLFMKKMEVTFVPFLTRLSFSQVNVRTYVTVNGEKGVYFLSLDANNHLAVLGGKIGFKSPYFYGKINYDHLQQKKVFLHERPITKIKFQASFEPFGDSFYTKPNTLENWLTDRSRFFTYSNVRIYYGDISHDKWKFQQVNATIQKNNLFLANHLPTPEHAPLLHYCKSLAVKGYPLRKVAPISQNSGK